MTKAHLAGHRFRPAHPTSDDVARRLPFIKSRFAPVPGEPWVADGSATARKVGDRAGSIHGQAHGIEDTNATRARRNVSSSFAPPVDRLWRVLAFFNFIQRPSVGTSSPTPWGNDLSASFRSGPVPKRQRRAAISPNPFARCIQP